MKVKINPLIATFLVIKLAWAQYEYAGSKMCEPEEEHHIIDLQRLEGHWYSLHDGLSLMDYHCIQINITELTDVSDDHHVYHFNHGFKVTTAVEGEDGPETLSTFIYDDEQFLYYNKSKHGGVAMMHNVQDEAPLDDDFYIGNQMNQTKRILDTDYESYLIIGFCHRHEDTYTKMVSLYVRDEPGTMDDQDLIKFAHLSEFTLQ